MALYSSHTSMVQRSKGQNAVAAAAYNARSKLEHEVVNKLTGIASKFTFDYSKKGGLAYSKIHASDGSPDWVYDRQKLWSRAEQCETRSNSQTARKIMIALPIELNEEQNVALLKEFVSHLVEMGMIVDANIHNDNLNNPHAHLMLTTRELIENRYGEIDFSAVKNRDWGKVAFVKWHRELWADLTNKHLQMHGFETRVSEKSYAELGIEIKPGVHEGPARNIKNAELVALNQSIAEENARRIIECPSLIIDKLVINKPVFTKEELAIELEKVLYAGIEFNEAKTRLKDNGLEIIDEKVSTGDDHTIDVISADHMEALDERANNILAKKEGVIKAQEQVDIEAFHVQMTQKYMELYNQLLCSPELSLVTEEDLKGRELYTSTKRLELEERYIETVEEMHGRKNHALGLEDSDLDILSVGEKVTLAARNIVSDIAKTDTMVAFAENLKRTTGIEFKSGGAKPPLSLEQRQAVLSILNGSDIAVLEGIPGSGKTTAMGEIVRHYKKAGYKVIGVAPSSAAALQLQKATGIESKNATLWRKQWLLEGKKEFELVLRADYFKEERYIENDSRLTNKHVMIIDEASMGELASMDYLLSEANKVGAKVLFVGDDNQFSAVGYAGALKKAINICGSNKLYESRRQSNPLHQEATKLLGQFRVREALDIYHKAGNIIIDENRSESRRRLVEDYIAQYLEKVGELKKDNLASIRSMVICTYTNVESAKLNEQVRTQLKEAGVIKGKEQSVLIGNKKLPLARGEQIVFTRNLNREGRSGIYNGEVGTVLKVSEPDKLGHAKIAILVNKANGEKEGIVLDTKSFNLEYGNLLDYGYAVTGYKLQGSTVDKSFALHEKQVGYEAFNVVMTRHREDVHLYVNKEDLHDVMYESLDIDSKKAQVHYSMIGEDDDITLSGLVKLTHKLVNNSFASDYFDMGLTAQDQHLKEYIANNVKATKLIQKIADWQQKEFRLCSAKPDLWEHELWEEFREVKEFRDSGAAYIKANYGSFKDRLIQLNMNYGTILKHAHMHEVAKDKTGNKKDEKNDQYLVEEKQTSFYVNNKNYEALIKCVDENAGLKAKVIYGELNTEIASIYSRIQDTHAKIQDLAEHESELQSAAQVEANYREVLLPSYLRTIYRKDKDVAADVDAGEEHHHGHDILAKYEELCKKHGAERAAKMVGDNLSILGKLEGIGIGRYLSFTSGRKDAVANAQNLGRQLMAYNRSMEMEQQYKQELINEDFYSKIMRLQNEIDHLKEQLPMSIDSKFLDEVGLALATGRSKGKEGVSQIDLSSLRDSELFQAVGLKNIQGKAEFAETPEILDKEALLGDNRPTTSLRAIEADVAIPGDKTNEKESGEVSLVKNDAYLKKQMKSLEHAELARQSKLEQSKSEDKSKKAETNISSDIKAQVQSKTLKVQKQELKQSKERSQRASLDFDEVKRALNSVHFERLFREYAHYINADGKIQKRGKSISCGSINMSLKDGLWYRFSDGSKGDIFNFIQQATGASVIESFEIIAQHLGIQPRDNRRDWAQKLNKGEDSTDKLESKNKPRDEWVAYDKVPNEAPKFKPGKDLSWLKQKGLKFAASYEYKNKEGELLGYAVRIEEIESGKKMVMPLTYAHNEVKGKSQWYFTGFSDGGDKPIYGHEKLAQDPEKLVLIVEGEKTANAAQKLLPDYTVISWMGGAKGANRVNWQELAGKEVVIWPDNDEPGHEAASSILSAVNKVNGFSGFCSIVDTKLLNLPEKWDLADEIPKDLDVRKAIASTRIKEKTIDDYEFKSRELKLKGEELAIFWQKAEQGLGVNSQVIREESENAQHIRNCIKTNGMINYMNYQVAKGRVDHPHEFLTLHDGLLQEMMAASVAGYIGHNARQEEAKELYEAIGSGSKDDAPLDGLAKKLLEIHKQASQAANVSLIKTSKQYSLDQQQLKEQNPDKAKLHEQLMRDFGILHEHQTRMPLTDLHIEVLSKDLSHIIKEYDLSYKGNTRVLNNTDSTSIAQTAHSQINNPNWWKKILEQQIKRKEEFKAKTHQQKAITNTKYVRELEIALKLNRNKLADIAVFDKKFDPKQFKEELLSLPTHKKAKSFEQDITKKIDELWGGTYKEHIGAKLDHFDKLKGQSKEAGKYLEIIKEQKDFSMHIDKNHDRLVREAEVSLKDKRIGSLMIYNEQNPEYVSIMERDIKHGVNVGLWTEQEAIKMLNEGEKQISLRMAAKTMFEKCQKHEVESAMNDLQTIDKHSFIEKDNMKFTDHKSYLEHHLNNPSLRPYLQNTKITQKLDEIYKHEEHQAKQMQQEHELQKTKEQEKTLEKEYTMHGPKL